MFIRVAHLATSHIDLSIYYGLFKLRFLGASENKKGCGKYNFGETARYYLFRKSPQQRKTTQIHPNPKNLETR